MSLKDKYLKDVRQKLMSEFAVLNMLAVPKINKVVINMGIGEAKDNEGLIEKAKVTLEAISGQKSVVTRAKKSIANFKLTKGSPIGLMVTLRGDKMFAFLEKLINIVLPRVRDFRGVVETSFDQKGNFNLGIREQIIFPEVDYQMVDKLRGLQITINTTAFNKEQGKRLLELLGMPFRKGGSV
ncbi:50S ribosomal protein L5 [Candidatus Daviesbacteria bacterium]|nr:50S ribosomal protein L5 [Candidatus Daviesbacteria bacterium]